MNEVIIMLYQKIEENSALQRQLETHNQQNALSSLLTLCQQGIQPKMNTNLAPQLPFKRLGGSPDNAM